MARRKDKLSLPPFVPLTWAILNSEAFKALSYASRSALPYFIGKTKRHIRAEDYLTTEFSFSYREAITYGYARKTFSRVISDLMRHGFIDPVDKGGLRGMGLSLNKFRMGDRWKQYGSPAFIPVEWKQFAPKFRKGTCPSVESEPVRKAM